MSKHCGVLIGMVVLLSSSIVSFSQNHVPVIQDGTPAELDQKPAPRTTSGKPDLTGVWGVPSTDESKILADRFGKPLQFGGVEKADPPSMTAWETERFEYNQDPRPVPGYAGAGDPKTDPQKFLSSEGNGTFGTRPELNPFYKCVPPTTPFLITSWGSNSVQEIIQTDKRVLMIYEYDHTIRQIWTDGRKHPDPVDLTWAGHSIGTWDGDTLVVDTVGLHNEFWLDGGGHVASTGLHIIERYRRVDKDTLQIDFTYEDPKAFKTPWARREYRRLRPKWELIEDVRCYPGSPELKVQEDDFNQQFTQP